MAGACALTAFAATVGLGANFSLFGLAAPESPVDRLDGARGVSSVSADTGVRELAGATGVGSGIAVRTAAVTAPDEVPADD